MKRLVLWSLGIFVIAVLIRGGAIMKFKKTIFMILMSILFAACGSNSNPGNEELGGSPPQPLIKAGEKTIKVYQSSYCWGNKCADYISPEEMLKDKHKEQIEANTNITYKFDVKKPTEVTLTRFHNGNLTQDALSDDSFQSPQEAGIYYYSLSAVWLKDKESRITEGSSSYVFVVEVVEKKAEPTAGVSKNPETPQPQEDNVQKELLLKRNFDSYIKLPEGYYYGSFVMLNEKEAVYISSKAGTEPLHNEIVKINLETQETMVLWEGTDSISYRLVSEASEEGRDTTVRFSTSNYEQKTFQEYIIEDGALPKKVPYRKESPDGKWDAISEDSTSENRLSGIWGLNTVSNQKTQWTTGQWDDQPLWMPDSSGFIYLHSTGKQIGDGAGPVYELARYDLKTNQTIILPFEKGYWGRIDWLIPGRTILSQNGFDDGIGYKIVDLLTQKEKQLFSTTHSIDYVRQALNPDSGKMLISEVGHFLFFNTQGELETTILWVTDLDDYTKKNPDFGSEEWVFHPYYLSNDDGHGLGPSNPEFSPDGKKLAYTLGLMGESGESVVPGSRIVISSENGSEPGWLMRDYFGISEFHWTPSSNRVIVHFKLPQSEGIYYLGIIEME